MARARFRPTRAGIINLWDYRDQEFSFADGRLVLRGPNGSGKTKALEVLFPFVLDGRIEPRRLNPFAGEERTMKSNLLYRGQDSAHSYVWMEFARGPQDDPEAVTVGIGMRATRQNDKVTRWHFVAEGRVGVDFSLLGSDDRPLTKRQLADQLGTDALTDRPTDYRAAIDARLFGLGAERYDQLINLILTLRRPQLAKNLDPKGLSQALTDGLRPLDEHLVLEAARSFSDMEEVGRALEGLAAADQAAQDFVTVYRKYLRQQARADVEQVSRRLESVEQGIGTLFDAAALQARRQEERLAAEERLTAAERDLEQSRSDLETLQRSGAYEGKQQLDDLAAVVAQLKLSTEQQSDKARKAQASLEQRAGESDRSAAAVSAATAALARAEDELQSAAEDAGIVWTPLPDAARTDQLTAAVRGHAEERDGDVRVVREALATVDKASTERTRADRAADRGRELLDAARAAVVEAEAGAQLARSECAKALRTWWTRNSATYASIGVSSEMFVALHDAVADVGDDESPSLATLLAEHTEEGLDAVRFRRQQAGADAAQAAATVAALTADRDRIAAESDDAPPAFAARTGSREHLSGAPLWRLVRFADDVDPAVAAGVESALQAANLLDGWVYGGEEAPDAASEQYLVPLPAGRRPAGPTLADVLLVEADAGVAEGRVEALLASISLRTAAEESGSENTVGEESGWTDAAVVVGHDGRFWQGVQQGRHTKTDAEYIGATARARRRELRLAELDAALEAAEAAREAALHTQRGTAELITAVAAAAKSLPRATPVLAALKAVTESAGALRTRSEAAASSQRELDQAIADLGAKEKALRSTAVAHRTPHLARDLDSLAAAIGHFEKQGELVLRCRREHAKEVEHLREADDRHAEARGIAEEHAEESAIAEESYAQQVQRLDMLRDLLGANADQIDADLEKARARIEECKVEQRAARKASDSAVEEIGKSAGAHHTAVETLRSALTEARADADRLAPYARRDLLELIGVTDTHSWPASAAAWLSADQLVYRIQNEDGPGSGASVLPPEVHALHSAMADATASVKVSDGARKATRTALTSALQDFDAQLAAAGQDYRLQWDAPDGLTTVRVQDEQGYSSIGEFAARIGGARADQEQLLTESERRILEDALLTGLAQQIHERTVDARELIGQMGAEMRERRMSSGSTIGVHWVLADNLDDNSRAISKLLDRDASGLGPDELATMRAHFAAQIRIARAAHPERSYPEILSTALDYRRWRVFSFTLIGGDGSEDRLTVARHGALSGGEQSVSLHLPLFAAAHVMLSSADPHSPRLLGLDEAFAGVDDNGRSELLGLSVQFDLDLFMTGYDLWVTYAGVPGCAHYDLAHSTAEQTVSAALLVWSGGELLAEHDGTDLARALGSPLRRRMLAPAEGGLEFAQA
ncbi:TIGR02680 family protein [Rhodococcus tukisamuensis]|uniref:TIGR02680 family protein n=1 Tax=Rhodococcus tukisamuensis TaxID=168276 RepID=A0A1G6U7A6_9NOCA|nr:TIGR02680 family protein [Rhodococcus tukisamuensis]SDD36435.1 TIGR02680 family protein [Rhodococcus tukisamuensis]